MTNLQAVADGRCLDLRIGRLLWRFAVRPVAHQSLDALCCQRVHIGNTQLFGDGKVCSDVLDDHVQFLVVVSSYGIGKKSESAPSLQQVHRDSKEHFAIGLGRRHVAGPHVHLQ